jgi:hypothetical protein
MNVLTKQKSLGFRAKRQADNDLRLAVLMLLLFFVGIGCLVVMQREWFMDSREYMVPVVFGLFEVQNTDVVMVWPMILVTAIAFAVMVLKGWRYWRHAMRGS